MDQIPSSNQAGASNAPSRPTYNNGTGYQNNNQVSQRPNDASIQRPGDVNQNATQPATTSVTTVRTDWVRFNTICNRELVNKVRAIADRNHSSIRDVVELMFRRCINAYEQKNVSSLLRRRNRWKNCSNSASVITSAIASFVPYPTMEQWHFYC